MATPPKIRVLFLGTGTSTGVPTVGCDCATCNSTDERDKRTRSSVLISWDEKGEGRNVLVDAATDLRFQALRHGLKRVDATLFTHPHADHVHGLDDLRCFNFVQKASIPCYGSDETMATIRTRFDYIFNPKYPNEGGGLPMISLNAVEGNFELFGATVTCLPVKHGSAEVFGFRIGSFAYVTDVKTIPDSTMEKIMGVKTVVLGAVQRKPHSTHLGLYEAIDVIKKIGAQKGYITHMNHDLMRSEIEPTLPEWVFLAYDGLVLNIEN